MTILLFNISLLAIKTVSGHFIFIVQSFENQKCNIDVAICDINVAKSVFIIRKNKKVITKTIFKNGLVNWLFGKTLLSSITVYFEKISYKNVNTHYRF